MTLAPNFHFLGRAGMKEIDGIKVLYLSGGYDPELFEIERHIIDPGEISDDDCRAQHKLACFTRKELAGLEKFSEPDIFLVHVWPFGLVRKEDHEHGEPKHRKLRYQETGVRVIRELIENISPQLVLCGHLHRRYQRWINNASCQKTLVQCLGEVSKGEESLALFQFSEGQIREVPL